MGVKLSWDETTALKQHMGRLGKITLGAAIGTPVARRGLMFYVHFYLTGEEAHCITVVEAKQWLEDRVEEWLEAADLRVRRVNTDGSGASVVHPNCKHCKEKLQ